MLASLPALMVSGPTAEITGSTSFNRWQYELILYSFVVATFALFAAGLYSLSTSKELSKRYRTAGIASTCVTWVATLAYVALTLVWLVQYTPNAAGTLYTPDPGTTVTALRYMDWSVTVPILVVEFLAVCTLSRTSSVNTRFAAMAAAFLMILTGFFGLIGVGQAGGPTTLSYAVWGAISTVFFIIIYVVLIKPYRETIASVTPTTATSLRNAVILLGSLFGAYPVIYLFLFWSSAGDAGWATASQLGFTAADIAAKAGFGLLLHKVAKLRTAEDAAGPAGSVPDTYPSEVWISSELVSLPTVGTATERAEVSVGAGRLTDGAHDGARDGATDGAATVTADARAATGRAPRTARRS